MLTMCYCLFCKKYRGTKFKSEPDLSLDEPVSYFVCDKYPERPGVPSDFRFEGKICPDCELTEKAKKSAIGDAFALGIGVISRTT